MSPKTSIFVIALGLVATLVSYQNCGKSNSPEHSTQMENAGILASEKIVNLNLRADPNPLIYQAPNNNLVWNANPQTPLFYFVYYSKLSETADTRTPTTNLWITLPTNLTSGAYRATLYSCYTATQNPARDCAFNSYTQFNIANSQGGGTPTPNPSPVPTATAPPGGGESNSNFTFNFKMGFTNSSGVFRTRIASENSPQIDILYRSTAPISFVTETTGNSNTTVCIFRDPTTSNGSCLPNNTYNFPAGHFVGPWHFEVTVRRGTTSKTRRINFTPH